jgi:hypothetical protein
MIPSDQVTEPRGHRIIGRSGHRIISSSAQWMICDLRFEICGFRSQQISSSSHLTLPIAETGECARPDKVRVDRSTSGGGIAFSHPLA